MSLIDTDALKAYIDAQIGRLFIGCTVGEALKILVDEQPTVEAEPRWIPFTLRELTADEKKNIQIGIAFLTANCRILVRPSW